VHREPDNLVLKGKWTHYILTVSEDEALFLAILLADAYLPDKVVREADKAFEDKYYSQSVFEK
jgi:hypothetical protein